ncbi:MAG: M20 family metallo-hydrolase [Acidimicrobiia bacterium]|nr:M20 family metallo-hydrolase [Acidimicrobiia bacterium]
MTTVVPHAVDGARLRGRLDELAAVGDTGDGGVCRLALTEADGAGRDLVVTWMRDLGLRVDIDGIGNVIGTWPADATGPAVMTGSHIDTVRTGGRFDGNYGVLAGLEVIETVIESGFVPARPLAVGFFTNEEGARFAPDMLGSLVYVGGLPLEEALDTVAIDGAVLGDELERIGYRGPLPCPASPPAAFVELHVEQGPILEAECITIGAVTSVQGILWFELTIVGQSNHAGTTPMRLRRDPALAAAEIAVTARSIARDLGGDQVATVGRIDLHPNLVNVIPARATLTVDLRNTDPVELARAERMLFDAVERIAAAESVTIEHRTLARFEPVVFDETVIGLVVDAAERRNLPVRRLPSGAGHDAQMLARVCPSAMIFVPSVGGVSHNPTEFTDADDLQAGADVLLDVMLRLADGPIDRPTDGGVHQ